MEMNRYLLTILLRMKETRILKIKEGNQTNTFKLDFSFLRKKSFKRLKNQHYSTNKNQNR
jgi:hypothetical protein